MITAIFFENPNFSYLFGNLLTQFCRADSCTVDLTLKLPVPVLCWGYFGARFLEICFLQKISTENDLTWGKISSKYGKNYTWKPNLSLDWENFTFWPTETFSLTRFSSLNNLCSLWTEFLGSSTLMLHTLVLTSFEYPTPHDLNFSSYAEQHSLSHNTYVCSHKWTEQICTVVYLKLPYFSDACTML